MVRYDSVKVLLAVAAQCNMHITQFDVKCAYIYGNIDKVVYMKQPLGFEDPNHANIVCLLQRSLYGCRQSGRCRNQRFVAYVTKLGFKQVNADACS